MKKGIYDHLTAATQRNKKQLAVLIDPDKIHSESLESLAELINYNRVDYVFVGTSLMVSSFLGECLSFLKESILAPLILFPGNSFQVNPLADSILLLSLISGRNPDLLIGSHVAAAPMLRKSGLEIIPTGYMLIESGKITSVVYMSNTLPIPHEKSDIAMSTAMAGEMLGMKLIYLDAGSGARMPVNPSMIRKVKDSISIPLIVGGGIGNADLARDAWLAGADLVVVGNALEKSPRLVEQLCYQRDCFNRVEA